MEKERNSLNLEGVIFIADAKLDALVELGNEHNLLRFSEMDYTDTHYELKYQPDYRQIAAKREIEIGQYLTVKLPHLTELDPEGMAARCNKPIHEIRGKMDFEVIVDPVQLERRIKGELPTVDILGHTYYTDIRMGSLRPKDDFMTEGLKVKELENYLSPDGSHYRVTIDPARHEIRPVDWEKLTEIPKGVVLVDIPAIQRLDPVGYARDFGREPVQFLRNHPPKQEHIATKVDWSDTLVMDIIFANRIRNVIDKVAKEQKQEMKRQQKPRHLH